MNKKCAALKCRYGSQEIVSDFLKGGKNMIKKWIHTVVIGMALTLSALTFGYFLYQPKASVAEERMPITPVQQLTATENTMIEYIYNYGDGITETTYSPIPPYLVGLTYDEAKEKMRGFELTYFDAEKITAVKQLEGDSRQHYVLGEKNGYIAVFYKKGGGLKEMTNTPANTISEDEKDELFANEIVGSDKLARIMENIES